MRRLALAAFLGGFAFSAVHAATLTVAVDGEPTTYTLSSLVVDASGNMNASVTSTSGAPATPTEEPDTPKEPAVPTEPPPVTPPATSTSCVASGALTCVDTSLTAQTFQRQSYKPSPSMVYAFKIKSPASGTFYARAIATRMTGAPQSKLLVVSTTPGDVSIEGKSRGCYRQSAEATTLQFVMNRPSISTLIACHLEPNQVYYINVASKNYSGLTTCTSSSNCGFYFEGS